LRDAGGRGDVGLLVFLGKGMSATETTRRMNGPAMLRYAQPVAIPTRCSRLWAADAGQLPGRSARTARFARQCAGDTAPVQVLKSSFTAFAAFLLAVCSQSRLRPFKSI